MKPKNRMESVPAIMEMGWRVPVAAVSRTGGKGHGRIIAWGLRSADDKEMPSAVVIFLLQNWYHWAQTVRNFLI